MATAHLVGLDERGELLALDFRFRYFSNAPQPQGILHVDIDDRSLKEVGQWPWPREHLARIVGLLRECGARAVVLDIIFPEPQEVRYVSREQELYRSYEGQITHDVAPVPVFDDALLASSITRAANVFVPAHLDFDPHHKPDRLYQAIAGLLAGDPSTSLQAVRAEVRGGPAGPSEETVAKAYLEVRSAAALKRFAIPPERVRGYALQPGRLVPPLLTFAEAAHGTGFVTFVPDEGGVMRRIHLIARGGGAIYPQFAMSVATGELRRRHGGSAEIYADASGVTIACADGQTRHIPVDPSGAMLVNWSRSTWEDPARHIRGAAVFNICELKTDLRQQGDAAYVLRLKLLEMGRAEPSDERLRTRFWEAVRLAKEFDKAYEQRVAQQRRVYRDSLYRPGQGGGASVLVELERKEQQARSKAWAMAEQVVAELRRPDNLDAFLGKPADGPAATSAPSAGRQAREQFQKDKATAGRLLEQLDALLGGYQRLKEDFARGKRELSDHVADKICLIGSTATGAADFVPTPLWPRTPGVVVHSNILNTMLSGAFLERSTTLTNVGVILVAGLLVALLAGSRPVLQAAPATLGLAGAYAVFNTLVVFHLWGTWLVLAAPLAAMAASFVVVTAYRQLTEERAKRHIKGLFAHAMSPALVERLLEDPSLAELGGQKRELSLLFSDVAGFTSLSENLGPQETVRLLNRYFDRVTQVIQDRCGGYLNKFLGDGIFAFFGAPVFQDDHARRAIEAAVACQQEVAQLNEELTREEGRDLALSVRIGVTTGEAMVGNCGSTHRMDYTAIGDCVNLASRLEGANKFFGTRILVDEPSWHQAARADLSGRPLGKIRVAGRLEPVDVWEIRTGADADQPQLRQALGDFARALGLFTTRRFAEAADLFRKVRRVLPEDKATHVYLEAARAHAARPPDAGWAGHVIDVSH